MLTVSKVENDGTVPPLRLSEKLFLKLWCLPPPARPFEPRDSYDANSPPPMDPDPLARTSRVYGNRLKEAIQGKVFLDIGCGLGDQVLGAACAGAALAVGIDHVQVNLQMANAHARRLGLDERVRFTTDTIPTFGTDWADVVLSQNSFEHFEDPAGILAQAYSALRPGGRFFITFGPPWWHPYGVHHMFMIRLPWAHSFFSIRTILRVRQLYRPNRPTSWAEVSLNKMTIKCFVELVKRSGFELSEMSMTPIRPLPAWLVRWRLFREWTTADVSVVLIKPGKSGS